MRRRATLALTLAGVLLLGAACGERAADQPSPEPSASGVKGMVLYGPVCPVVVMNSPCPDQPYDADVVARDSAGDEVARGRSGADGRFELGLEPGRYVLEAVPDKQGISLGTPVDVVVREGEYTNVTLSVDSGIR